MAERRQRARINVRIKFSYEMLEPKERPQPRRNAVTKDISSRGFLFENESEIPLGARLRANLSLPGSPPHPIEVNAEVVRVERLQELPKFDIGVMFVDLPADIEEEIKQRIERMDILRLLKESAGHKASDIHLTCGSPAMLRIHGKIRPLKPETQPLSAGEIEQMVYSILSRTQRQKFEQAKDLDFVYSLGTDLRFRVSVYQQRGNAEVVFRIIPSQIKSRQELGLPDLIEELCRLTDGIIVIAGTTGSGKTTTIASMIDIINRTRGGVVLSLEKPIEYVHKNIKGIIKQREVGMDVPSFASGLTASLRQDPDIIVVGEVIDADTIETALNAAETGHLVITSIHAADTLQVLDRVISLFSVEQQAFISNRLSHCLRAIITQALLPHKNGIERILATEVCIANYAVKKTVHDRNLMQLNSIIQSSAQLGMRLMQSSIDKIFEQGLITGETYEIYSKKK